MSVIVRDVSKRMGKNDVVRNVSIEVDPGTVVGLQGINGSGKTMLMRAVCGLIRPTEGEIIIDGQRLGADISFPPSLGMLIEAPSFLGYLSGYDNLELIAQIKGVATPEDIRSALRLVGLDADEKKKFRAYSLGMKQRLGIAAAIMEKPKLLVLDEPTNALDEAGVEMLKRVVASPFEAQLSLLLATPRVAGGEGLRSFSNNARIVLSGKAARLAGRYNCYADFLFEETGDKKPLVVECQGRLVHSGADAAMSDSDRATALQQMGFNVMLLTYQQIADEKNFEIVKRMLFEEIGLEHREKTDASLMRSAVFVASSLSIGTRWGTKVSEPCPYLCSCETLQ